MPLCEEEVAFLGGESGWRSCWKVDGKLHHSEVGEKAMVGRSFLVEGEGIGAG